MRPILARSVCLFVAVSLLQLAPTDTPDPEAGVGIGTALSRRGSLAPRYNFPPVTRGDRFAHQGLDMRIGIRGWRRYGNLIKEVARREGVDPHVLGAYVWVESKFNPRQDYKSGRMQAVGLGSVQAQDNRRYTVRELQDPALNLTLTAREFKRNWQHQDMAGTIMDVWYPAWRRMGGKPLPVVGEPGVYVQAIANRYAALCRIDTGHDLALPTNSSRKPLTPRSTSGTLKPVPAQVAEWQTH